MVLVNGASLLSCFGVVRLSHGLTTAVVHGTFHVSSSAVLKHSFNVRFISGDSVPSTFSTLSVYTVTSTQHETTESRTKPVAWPSGVLESMNKQAASLANERFFVTSATTIVETTPAYASDCTTTAGRFFPRNPRDAENAPG